MSYNAAVLCQLSCTYPFPRPHVDKCHPEFHVEWGQTMTLFLDF